jgi:hypothetical protein
MKDAESSQLCTGSSLRTAATQVHQRPHIPDENYQVAAASPFWEVVAMLDSLGANVTRGGDRSFAALAWTKTERSKSSHS